MAEPLGVFTRVFDAPRELVFKAYTDPKRIACAHGSSVRGWGLPSWGRGPSRGGARAEGVHVDYAHALHAEELIYTAHLTSPAVIGAFARA